MKTLLAKLLALLGLAVACHGFQMAPRTLLSTTAKKMGSHRISSKESLSSRQSAFRLFYQDDNDGERQRIELANNFLRASRSSFKNVESITNYLLNENPAIAIGIFVTVGLVVAYMTGFFFLGGYIETWNPAENDSIPYWDDEVLVITRYKGR